MLITSRQRSLAFRKVRRREKRGVPGYHRFRETPRFLPGSLGSFQCGGAARLYSVILFSLSGPARAVSSPARAGGFFISRALWCSFRFLLCFVHRLPESTEQCRRKEDI